jgi:hypothetical protein
MFGTDLLLAKEVVSFAPARATPKRRFAGTLRAGGRDRLSRPRPTLRRETSRVPASARQSQNAPVSYPRSVETSPSQATLNPYLQGFCVIPLTDSNRPPPPYHGTTQASGRNPRQRFSLVWAVLEAVPFASDCHGLRPLGSIKAPRLVAYVGYGARNWTSSVGWSVR